MNKKLLLSLLAITVSLTGFSQSSATYTVTFDSNWSTATHPSGSFPGNAHWSKFVGATHNDNITFLEMGGIATQGIEDVAEQGVNTQFYAEVNAAISNGDASLLIDGDALPTGLGQVVISDVTTPDTHPYLTIVSMIAPSPDWIVAVSSVPLIDGNGDWINEIEIDLYPYDAGTDSGTDYNSPNMDVTPHEPISSLQGVAPFSSETMGTLTITLETVLGVDDNSFANAVTMAPNPAMTSTTITSARNPITQVEVYNVIGERVYVAGQMSTTRFELDLSDLSSGIYLVKTIDSENNETLKKLVRR